MRQSIKVRVIEGPVHYEVTFFIGPENGTRANVGTLRMRPDDWDALRAVLEDFIDRDHTHLGVSDVDYEFSGPLSALSALGPLSALSALDDPLKIAIRYLDEHGPVSREDLSTAIGFNEAQVQVLLLHLASNGKLVFVDGKIGIRKTLVPLGDAEVDHLWLKKDAN